MLDFKTVMKRLPATTLIWLVGVITCVIFYNFLTGLAASLSGGDFILYATYVPYLIMVVCTAVSIWLACRPRVCSRSCRQLARGIRG